MPHISKSCPSKDVGALYAKMNQDTAPVGVRFNRPWFLNLKESMMSDPSIRVSGVALSVQDCLTAYITATVNRFLAVPIVTITNAASVGPAVMTSCPLVADEGYSIGMSLPLP